MFDVLLHPNQLDFLFVFFWVGGIFFFSASLHPRCSLIRFRKREAKTPARDCDVTSINHYQMANRARTHAQPLGGGVFFSLDCQVVKVVK